MARIWPPAQNQFITEERFNVDMPSMEVQRHLLDLYFIYVHPLYPVVHKTLFWKDFESLYVLNSLRYSSRLPLISYLLIALLAETRESPHPQILSPRY